MNESIYQDWLDAELPNSTRGRFLPLLMSAATASTSLFNEKQPGFFAGKITSNIKGHIFSYAVLKQFSPEFLPKSLPIQCQLLRVNNFGYLVPEIRTKNTVLYIVRGRDPRKLPKPLYLRNKAMYNDACQLSIDFDVNPLKIIKEPRCLVLYYGSYDNESIAFANLVLPDFRLGYFHTNLDLRNEMMLHYNSEVDINRHVEKEVAKLKPELVKQLNLMKGDSSE